jgi:hypothetical protein
VYAHLAAQPVTKQTDLTALVSEGAALKQALLVAADALAHAGLVDGAKLAEIRAGSGHLDLAGDLVALGALFDVSWALVAGKTAVERAQIERASSLGTELLAALGAKDHLSNRVTPESIELRDRTFTLLVSAYDDARRALSYLRWADDDVDLIAPSLYQRTRRRAASSAAPEPQSAQPASASGAE